MQLRQLKAELENPDISYPDYYLKKFHAYQLGNLDWQAVCELESATASLAVAVFKHEHLKPDVAENAMRNSFLNALQVPHFNTPAHDWPTCCLLVARLAVLLLLSRCAEQQS